MGADHVIANAHDEVCETNQISDHILHPLFPCDLVAPEVSMLQHG
jgi:hypothetical protein